MEGLLARQAAARRPRRLQLAGRLHRLPRLFGDDADEVLSDDDFHDARDILHRAFVDAYQRRPDGRRPNDPPVQHSRHAHVVDVFELAGGHRRNVHARHRLAEHRPFARILAARVRVERNVECPSADEVAVCDVLRRVALHADDAVLHGKLIRRCAETRRRELNERLARRRAGERQVALVEVGRMRLRPRRRPLIRRARRVALNERHPIERHAQLFGDQLRLRGVEAMAQLAFAGVGRHVAVGGDRDPRIELGTSGAVEPLR